MFRNVARLKRIAAGRSERRLFISTTSAESIAMSEPAPIAMPMSALVRAGASFIPSPTIITLPFCCNFATALSFPSGRTPAITWSTPAFSPIVLAVRSLSPVSITTRIPIFRISFIASGLSSLIVSATAMIPQSLPSRAKKRGVFPSCESCSDFSLISCGTKVCWLINP